MMLHRQRTIPYRAALTWTILFLCLLLSSPATLASASVPEAPNVPNHDGAQAVIVYNADYGEILFEKNADKPLFPASTVKIMTGLLAAELLQNRMEEIVIVTDAMLKNSAGNRMSLKNGEEIRIRDLFFGAICGGYNDACLVLAHLASGSVDAFVTQMNAKAAQLGMESTRYENPTGLHSAAMVTTARDTLTLSIAASENQFYMDAASAVKHTVPETNVNKARTFYNRNYLIASAVTTEYHNPYVNGLNAGMTDEGGWCVAARAFRFDLTWFSVVLGGSENSDDGTVYAYQITNNLLSWAARGYELKSVVTAGTECARLEALHAAIPDVSEDGFAAVASTDLNLFLPKAVASGEEGLGYTVLLPHEKLLAPFEIGAEIGTLVITWNGEEIGRVPLVTNDSAARNEFTYTLSRLKDLPKSRTFMASLISFIVLLTLYFARAPRYRYKKVRRSASYVPIPFRQVNAERLTPPPRQPAPPPKQYPAPPQMSAPQRNPAPPQRRSPSAGAASAPKGAEHPRTQKNDPYAGAANELEARKRPPKQQK